MASDFSLRTEQLAYLAGLIDGEGCLCIKKHRRRSGCVHYSVEISIGMCSDVLLSIVEEFGFGTLSFRKGQRAGWKSTWIWKFGRKVLCWLLPKIMQFLRFKKRQAMTAMEFMQSHGFHCRGKNKLAVERIWKCMSYLNKKGA